MYGRDYTVYMSVNQFCVLMLCDSFHFWLMAFPFAILGTVSLWNIFMAFYPICVKEV